MMRFLMALFVAVLASGPAVADSSFAVGVWSGSGPRHHFGHRHFAHRPYWGPRHFRSRSSVFVYSAPVYAAPYYYPAPIYAPPPRVYVPSYAPAPIASTGQCTVFNGDATIDGSGTPFYGRACIFTDGRWHIVP